MVGYSDGCWGITRDGQPIDGMEWGPDQMAECCRKVLDLARLSET
jgi:hypothetical protein